MALVADGNIGSVQHIVLCSITSREITVALQPDETCGRIKKNVTKRYISTVSEKQE